MRAVDDSFACRDFLYTVHKDGAFGGQLVHNVAVMNDFLANIDGRAKGFQRDADNIDGANHPGAKASRLQQK